MTTSGRSRASRSDKGTKSSRQASPASPLVEASGRRYSAFVAGTALALSVVSAGIAVQEPLFALACPSEAGGPAAFWYPAAVCLLFLYLWYLVVSQGKPRPRWLRWLLHIAPRVKRGTLHKTLAVAPEASPQPLDALRTQPAGEKARVSPVERRA